MSTPAVGEAEVEAQRRLNARRPTGPAEEVAFRKLRSIGVADGGFISPDDLPKFGSDVAAFDTALEKHVVDRGWFGEKPSKVVARWTGRGVLAIIAGVIGIVAGLNIPISGLTLIGAAAIAGGIVVIVFAQAMPAVSMSGAMIRAMLAAYRRTLQKTMAQARSMQQVVDEAGLDWLDTPDQAVVWGTALGLQGDIEGVLSRSLADVKAGTTAGTVPYFPAWYQTSSGSAVPRRVGRDGERRERVLGFGDPGHRRDDVGARDDRELPVVVGQQQRRRRVQRRRLGRWRRGRRRRVLGRRASGPEHLAAGVEALDGDRAARPRPPALDRHPEPLGLARRRPPAPGCRTRSARSRASATRRSTPRCRGTPPSSRPGRAEAVERERQDGRAHLLAEAAALERPARATTRCRPSACTAKSSASTDCAPIGSPSSSTIRFRNQRSGVHVPRARPVVLHEAAFEGRARQRRPGDPERHRRRAGGCRPGRPAAGGRGRLRSAAGGRAARCARADRRAATRPSASSGHPWAPDGTLRPWVLSRRWKTSSRSSMPASARPRSR